MKIHWGHGRQRHIMVVVVVSRKKTKGNEKKQEKIRIKPGKEMQRREHPSCQPL